MRESVKAGMGFGVTSGVLTTIGLMAGLYAGSHSATIIIGGVLTIAVADALSDSFGMHISQEARKKHSPKNVWSAALSTFLTKLVIASSFIAPLIFFALEEAVLAAVAWGIALLSAESYFIAKQGAEGPAKIILGHIALAAVVVAASYLIGSWAGAAFA
jgi:hypothetical protein